MKNSTFITIIVPIYKVEKFLPECLDSIINQTKKNFNVILINDGSPDKSDEIAKSYVKKYPNLFSYYAQENHGIGYTRNKGIQLSNSPYTMFLDSDDFLTPKCLENVTNAIKSANAPVDMLFMIPICYDCVTNTYYEWPDSKLIDKIWENEKIVNPSNTPLMQDLECNICRIVWRTDFLKNSGVKFQTDTKWEDIYPRCHFVHLAKTAIRMKSTGTYFYRVNSDRPQVINSFDNRLDQVKSFLFLFKLALKQKWNVNELTYIFDVSVRMLLAWSLNSIDETKSRKHLIRKLHSLYVKIPYKIIKRYYKIFKPKTMVRVTIFALRHKLLYPLLFNKDKSYRRFYFFKSSLELLGLENFVKEHIIN